MKIAALSDNHENYNFDVPPADLLIHAGDFSYTGKPIEIYNFIEWINKQPHEYKLWIPGNHELSLEDFPYNIEVIEKETDAVCMHNKEITIKGIKFFGSAFTPRFMGWAFMHNLEEANRYWKNVPDAIDVLITHGPPLNYLDSNTKGEHCGSLSQYAYIEKVRPKVNVFGHIHEGYGHITKQWKNTNEHTAFYNVCILNSRYKLENNVTVFHVK